MLILIKKLEDWKITKSNLGQASRVCHEKGHESSTCLLHLPDISWSHHHEMFVQEQICTSDKRFSELLTYFFGGDVDEEGSESPNSSSCTATSAMFRRCPTCSSILRISPRNLMERS